MEDNDLFFDGVTRSSPKSVLGVKLLICYALASLDEPIARQSFCAFLQKEGYVNFFTANTVLDELIADGTVVELDYHEKPSLQGTQKGKEIASTLENELYASVREGVVKGCLKLVSRERSERENDVIIEKKDDGYDVTLQIKNADEILLAVTVKVADALQAEQLKEGFLKSPGGLYSDIITRLTENAE